MSSTEHKTIYKIVSKDEWAEAEQAGQFDGAPIDLKDGYIHFSTEQQVRETAAKHFAGQNGLLLVEVATNVLEDLRWEVSRGGALFPHLYGPLSLKSVVNVWELKMSEQQGHDFSMLDQRS